MDWYRIRHTVGLHCCLTANGRAEYLKKRGIFHHVGERCAFMFRKVPLYPGLISVGNNVVIGSQVLLITHDAIHHVLNGRGQGERWQEYIGCIDIRDNVFLGSNSIILPNVTVGPDVVVGAGTLVNKSIRNGVYAGVPARYICSLEEFAEKRRNAEITVVKDKKGYLSEQTLREMWDRFRETREERHE